jgi:hypothetical protein
MEKQVKKTSRDVKQLIRAKRLLAHDGVAGVQLSFPFFEAPKDLITGQFIRKKVKHYTLKEKREEVVRLLGGKCVKCGITDIRCLQIDHVFGGGVKEYKKLRCGREYYVSMLRQVEAGSVKYQVLCANCNWIKRSVEKEYSPFQKERIVIERECR